MKRKERKKEECLDSCSELSAQPGGLRGIAPARRAILETKLELSLSLSPSLFHSPLKHS